MNEEHFYPTEKHGLHWGMFRIENKPKHEPEVEAARAKKDFEPGGIYRGLIINKEA